MTSFRIFNSDGEPVPKPHYFYRSTGRSDFEFVRPTMDSFNMVEVRKAYIYPRHRHANYQLILAERGDYVCKLNGVELVLKPRDVLLIKRGDWHEDVCHAGLRYLAINFDLSGNNDARATDIVFQAGVVPAQQVIRGTNAEAWTIVERMRKEPRHNDHMVAHIENALLQQLFWWLVRALPHEILSPVLLEQFEPQDFSKRLRRLFHDRLAEGLPAAAIAAHFGVSVRTLTKRCRKIMGQPPARAFMHYKMECAAHALRQSNISVKELSSRLGFQDQYHFSHAFRRYFRVPPSAYRGVPK